MMRLLNDRMKSQDNMDMQLFGFATTPKKKMFLTICFLFAFFLQKVMFRYHQAAFGLLFF